MPGRSVTPEDGSEKYRCEPGRPCAEVTDRLTQVDRDRELLCLHGLDDDEHARRALDMLRQRAAWQALGHDYGQVSQMGQLRGEGKP